jgi:hypothetical protein
MIQMETTMSDTQNEFKDSKGGKVTIESWASGAVRFEDEKTMFRVWPELGGLNGYDLEIIKGNPQNSEFRSTATSMKCFGRSVPGRMIFKDIIAASPNVLQAVARDRVQQFAEAHPEIAAQIKDANIPVALMNGKPATLAELEKYPSCYRACPADNKKEIVQYRCGK